MLFWEISDPFFVIEKPRGCPFSGGSLSFKREENDLEKILRRMIERRVGRQKISETDRAATDSAADFICSMTGCEKFSENSE